MSSSEGPTDEQYLSPLPTFAFIKQDTASLHLNSHTPSRRHTHHSRRHKEKQTATHFLNGDNLVGVLVSGLVNRGKLDRKTGVMLNL